MHVSFFFFAKCMLHLRNASQPNSMRAALTPSISPQPFNFPTDLSQGQIDSSIHTKAKKEQSQGQYNWHIIPYSVIFDKHAF